MNQNQTPPVTDTFDITGDLPASGVTLIEASAGTGKTWTVAALATRYVAERGIPLDQLLVVTFSRAASQELRERVRARLEETLTLLESGDPSDDPLVAHLRDCDTNELALRVRRLRAAVADFDTATIATTPTSAMSESTPRPSNRFRAPGRSARLGRRPSWSTACTVNPNTTPAVASPAKPSGA